MSHQCVRCHGRRFLKFVSEKRIDVIQDGLICFTPPEQLNDPFEVNPTVIELDPENYNLREKNLFNIDILTREDHEYSFARGLRKYEYRDKYQRFTNTFGILSLVSSDEMSIMPGIEVVNPKDPRRNLLMWSHYANDHKGFVIEFSSDFMASAGVSEKDILEVDYTDERPGILYEDIDSECMRAFYVKGLSWKYEQEWRIVRPLSNATEVKNDKNHLFEFNRSSIISITAGCRMSSLNKNLLKNLIKTDPELANTQYLEARIGNESNTVVFDQIIFDGEREWSNGPIFGNGMEMFEVGFSQLSPSSMKKIFRNDHEN